MPINEELDFLVSRVAKVRKWLAVIAILKTAVICLLFVCCYIGGYILLDHWLNLGILGRFAAFFLLIGLTIILVYRLSRLLLVQISYTNAANFIENNYSLNQQLVTAMEYYENRTDYPYSKVLAEQIIIRVNKDSESFRFDSVVEKWRGFALAAAVFIGMGIVGLYVQHNLSFLKTYLARLAVPFAAVEPVSATALEMITGDIASEPESMLVLAAGIKGRIPETGKLIIAPVEQDSNNREIQLHPIVETSKEPKFETSEFFPSIGKFQYRFETGDVKTKWQSIDIREAPKIKSITAEVALPEYIHDDNVLKNYTEQVKNNSLELIQSSKVTLHVEATSRLSEIELKEPGGSSSKKRLEDVNAFSHTFNAITEGSFEFILTDDKGLKSKNIPNLKINIKTDTPPQFSLISPDGDYLATDVSSIPIEFDISDDFGLNTAQFVAEFPKGEPITIDIPIENDSNNAKFNYILELEKYNLAVGDSIMFYAKAKDVKTAVSGRQNTASSEIYFIEIRPYLQIWHIKSGGGQSQIPGRIGEDLTTLLEYTRAFIKKTSVIASKTSLSSDDNSKISSIKSDVDYSSELLKNLRDDPQNEFNDAQKNVLNEILANYEKASGSLERRDALNALTDEKEAYRILRKFILELEMEYNPPDSGTTIPEEKPDKIELKEKIEPPKMEQERVQDELEKVQNEIEQLQSEQKQLKSNLEKVLEKQKEANQKAITKSQTEQNASKSGISKDGNPSQKGENSSGKGQSGDQGEGTSQKGENGTGQGENGDSQKGDSSQSGQNGSGQNGTNGQQSGDNQGKGEGNSGKGTGQKGDGSKPGEGNSGQGNGSQQSNNAEKGSNGSGKGSGNQQNNSQTKGQDAKGEDNNDQQGNPVQQDKGGTGNTNPSMSTNPENNMQGQSNIPDKESYEQSGIKALADAQLKMLQAKQAELQRSVTQLKQKLDSISQSSQAGTNNAAKEAQERLDEASEYMEQVQNKLDELRYEPQGHDIKASKANELMDSVSEKLDSAGNAIESGLEANGENQLANQLKENAEQLLEDSTKLNDELTELEKEQMLARYEAAKRLLESMAGVHRSNVGGGRNNSTSGGHVLTEGGSIVKNSVIEISRSLWTYAFELEKRQEKPVEDEPSDSRFSEVENSFFENAAKYNSGDDKK
jgi:hypothetical protein